MWFYICLVAFVNIDKLCLQVDTQSQILVSQVDEIRSGDLGTFENQRMQELKELVINYAYENKKLCSYRQH